MIFLWILAIVLFLLAYLRGAKLLSERSRYKEMAESAISALANDGLEKKNLEVKLGCQERIIERQKISFLRCLSQRNGYQKQAAMWKRYYEREKEYSADREEEAGFYFKVLIAQIEAFEKTQRTDESRCANATSTTSLPVLD